MPETSPGVILMIFYVYLLARWQHVKRPLFYLLGAAGLVFGMLGGFFGHSETGAAVARIFGTIGVIVAFVSAVGACYGSELPVKIASPLMQSQPAASSQSGQPTQNPPPAVK